MPTPQELTSKFWQRLATDRTMMLGLNGVDEGHTRPMTAQVEEEQGPIWFFTSSNTKLVSDLQSSRQAIATFSSKNHDLFATVQGNLSVHNDHNTIDRLWNPWVAAWYKGGKDDPELVLLRFDADRAEIWQDGSSLMAGIKMLLGTDPKQRYKENVAKVGLR